MIERDNTVSAAYRVATENRVYSRKDKERFLEMHNRYLSLFFEDKSDLIPFQEKNLPMKTLVDVVESLLAKHDGVTPWQFTVDQDFLLTMYRAGALKFLGKEIKDGIPTDLSKPFKFKLRENEQNPDAPTGPISDQPGLHSL